MKTNASRTLFLRLALLSCAASCLASCSTFESPLTRHDMDGDRMISHSEYQQNNMQYNLAGRQRADEYDRARQISRHIANANDILGGINGGIGLLRNFGR